LSILKLRRVLVTRSHRGQSLLIMALMFTVLIGVVGLAVDGAIAYGYSVSIERAVAAAALAGEPYMPQNFNGASPSATTRAKDEAKRNGFDPGIATCKCAVTTAQSNDNKNLQVTIKQTVPTFFMAALGFPPFDITRTAESGSRPPISLGSPDNQFGSTVSQIGSAGQFYILRQKGWHVGGGRAEGDGYTVDPSYDSPGQTSNDIHAISRAQGNESTDPNFTGFVTGGDRGGLNYRVVIPNSSPTGGEIQVYNAGFGPDVQSDGSTPNNPCENWQNPTVANGKCNANSAQNLHEDDGGQPPCSGNCSGEQGTYNTVMYTLFQVKDTFVRSNDVMIMQTKVFPIDASKYNASPPSYTDVRTGTSYTQTYQSGGPRNGAPTNFLTYHSWSNVGNEPASPIVQKTGFGICSGGCPALPAGTYRLRVDLLDWQGNFVSTGKSNHGFSLRVVQPNTLPESSSTANVCTGVDGGGNPAKCTLSGWEDSVAYTPLQCAPNTACPYYIPLFQLPIEYAGTTIDVDLYDFGDVGGALNVSIIDPTASGNCSTTPPCGGVANATGLTLKNDGINRSGNPLLQHVAGTNSQSPSGAVPNAGNPDDVPHLLGPTFASWCVAGCSNGTHPFNGSWIRISIPVPTTYAPTPGTDFWYVRYELPSTGGGSNASDTFSFAVAAQGGPVHLISS
jgi:hypothetical protein